MFKFMKKLKVMKLTLSIISFGQIKKSGINRLSRLLENLNQIIRLCRVVAREQSVCSSSLLTAASASNSVYVIFRVIWIIVVDNKLDIVDI